MKLTYLKSHDNFFFIIFTNAKEICFLIKVDKVPSQILTRKRSVAVFFDNDKQV